MTNKGNYYITTAIAYASGKPHIGNTYEIILADAIARYKRMEGYNVFFQTGTDEHGQKIEEKAKAAGMTPKAFVDMTAAEIRRIWDLMNTSYDKFIRTTDDYHEKEVQNIFKKLYEQGDIYKGYYEGWYCTPCESFYTESQLEDGKCPVCGSPVTQAKEEAYFFKMSKYAPRLIEHINNNPKFIQPVSRKNEMMNNFLLPGLTDLCVSRTSFKWGIPVDFDPGHVVYVWLDALTNYITGVGYHCYEECADRYKAFWPADLHLIGKDIIRFHTIYWPIFLMALGVELPKQVFGHPWLLTASAKSEEGVKMSKSKGNVVYADDLVGLFGVDAVRYFVLHEMPFENDGVISWELMVERLNSDLANTLGNLVNRTIAMTNKYFGGEVTHSGEAGGQEDVDADLKAVVTGTAAKVAEKMEDLRVADALTEIFTLFKRCNKYIDETEPWKLAKEEDKKARLQEVLYNLLSGIQIGASILEPFMPETSGRIFAQIGADAIAFDELGGWGRYGAADAAVGAVCGRVTDKPEILFARQDIKEVAARVTAEAEAAAAAAGTAESCCAEAKEEGSDPAGASADIHVETRDEITYDDFAKLQFVVGEVVDCKAVEKSKKLLRSQVKIGDRTVQILSGIRAYYTPEEMVGKKVMVLLNLAPRKMAGFESQGMLLCAETPDGRISLMTPDDAAVDNGSEIC